MSEEEVEFYVPENIDSDEVRQEALGGDKLLDRDAYGDYVFALKQFRYKSKKRPHYRAEVTVVSSDNPSLPAGSRTSLYLSTGPQPEEWQRIKDEVKLTGLVRALHKAAPDEPIMVGEKLLELQKLGRIDTDALRFRFIRKPGKTMERYNKKEKKLEEVTYEVDEYLVDES